LIVTVLLHVLILLYSIHLLELHISDEFAAHVGNVNCLALGHKSGRVMVSGGDDRKVNMWAVGKPTCIMVSTLIVQ